MKSETDSSFHENYEKENYWWCQLCGRWEKGSCQYETRRNNLFMSVKEALDN